jgi:CheY-like chemotaxis protein
MPTPNTNKPASRLIVSERGKKLNSLRLDDRTLNAVLDRLDGEPEGQSPSTHRTYVRWPFRHTDIEVALTHPGGTKSSVLMACRNLSCGGISLLHNAYIHVNTPVEVLLPHPFRGQVAQVGKVTRCRHRGGLLHEVGVKFAKQINVRDFIRPDPFREYFSLERVDPAQLRGTLLYVEDSLLDQRIVKHYLRESSLNVKTAMNCAEAIAAAQQGVDLIVSDFHLPDCDGPQFVKEARDAGIAAPVIMVTSDNSSTTRTKVRDCAADAFLAKPLTQERLLRAVAEFLLVASPTGLMSTSLPDTAPLHSLVTAFVDQLHSFATKLSGCLKDEKPEECFTICQQIRGTAPTLGFESIGKLAARTAEIVARTGSVKESARPVQELITACERVAA